MIVIRKRRCDLAMKSIIINTNGNITTEDLTDLKDYKKAVDGCIEGIGFPNFDSCGYVNENGKIENLPFNILATVIYLMGNSDDIEIVKEIYKNKVLNQAKIFDFIVGNMIICGSLRDDGECNDVSEKVVKLVNSVQQYLLKGKNFEVIEAIWHDLKSNSSFLKGI